MEIKTLRRPRPYDPLLCNSRSRVREERRRAKAMLVADDWVQACSAAWEEAEARGDEEAVARLRAEHAAAVAAVRRRAREEVWAEWRATEPERRRLAEQRYEAEAARQEQWAAEERRAEEERRRAADVAARERLWADEDGDQARADVVAERLVDGPRGCRRSADPVVRDAWLAERAKLRALGGEASPFTVPDHRSVDAVSVGPTTPRLPHGVAPGHGPA